MKTILLLIVDVKVAVPMCHFAVVVLAALTVFVMMPSAADA